MSNAKIREFVKLVTSNRIHGYDEGGHKAQFRDLGLYTLHALAAKLGYSKGTYDVRWNAAGPAVSGDLTLHTNEVYVSMGQSCIGNNWYYRSCNGKTDYTGGYNQVRKWDELKNLEKLAGEIRRVVGNIPDRPPLPIPRTCKPRKPRIAKVVGPWPSVHDALCAKLSPQRLKGIFSPILIGLVGDLLQWDGPRSNMVVTSDQFVLIKGGQGFLGSLDQVRTNCLKACDYVGDITEEERKYLLRLIEARKYP